MILVNALFFGVVVVLVRQLFDEWLGSRLIEKVEVKEHRFIPLHLLPGVGPPSFGSVSPNIGGQTWNLRVANDTGGGWVQVSAELYKSTKAGDELLVTGVKGKFTGYWYLKLADQTRRAID